MLWVRLDRLVNMYHIYASLCCLVLDVRVNVILSEILLSYLQRVRSIWSNGSLLFRIFEYTAAGRYLRIRNFLKQGLSFSIWGDMLVLHQYRKVVAAGQHFHLRETNNQVFRGSDLWFRAQIHKSMSSLNFRTDQLLLLWGKLDISSWFFSVNIANVNMGEVVCFLTAAIVNKSSVFQYPDKWKHHCLYLWSYINVKYYVLMNLFCYGSLCLIVHYCLLCIYTRCWYPFISSWVLAPMLTKNPLCLWTTAHRLLR